MARHFPNNADKSRRHTPCAVCKMTTTSFPLRHTECAYYVKRRARVPVNAVNDFRCGERFPRRNLKSQKTNNKQIFVLVRKFWTNAIGSQQLSHENAYRLPFVF